MGGVSPDMIRVIKSTRKRWAGHVQYETEREDKIY